MSSAAVITEVMEQAIVDSIFPAAELLVAHEGKILYHDWHGAARQGMLFDIASLTKPICTATLTTILLRDGALKLSDTLFQWLGGARLEAHRRITLEMLLNHTSGLPAWQPYYQAIPFSLIGRAEGRKMIIDACFQEETIAPLGTTTRYSDIGYLLLGLVLEEAGGAPLDRLFHKRIAIPVGLAETFFSPAGAAIHDERRFAPTEDCPWRKKVLHGIVHDQNAHALGGVAGHAGLFSQAADLHRFLSAWTAAWKGESSWLDPAALHSLFDFSHINRRQKELFLGGWMLPSLHASSAGRYFSAKSIGHLGFTGCSLWHDLEKGCSVILLTNRVHPSATNEKIKAFRPALHDLVMKEIIR